MLNPQLSTWLHQLNALTPEMAPTPEMMRTGMATLTASFITHLPDIARVEDASLQNAERKVPIRVYDPAPNTAKGVCVYLHGGGHMTGSIKVYDGICRKLAASSQQLVVAVDYALAPEHPYPEGLHDARLVVEHIQAWLKQHHYAVTNQLYVAGDSAGGALTASLAAMLQDSTTTHIDKQVLIYPSLDYTLSMPSLDNNGWGYFLEKPRIEWYFKQYFQHLEDRQQVSPLFMPITKRMPPTLIITAGFCPLRDEGEAYYQRLLDADIPCQHILMQDQIHAYLNLENLVPDACRQTYQAIARFLNA